MNKHLNKMFSVFTILALMLMALPAQSAGAVSSDIVISQVYGGGGNSGATLTNDFIELFNRGAATVDVTGWSVQYASSSGTTWQVTSLSGMVQPGQYYLVQEAAGSGGTTPLPTPDATGSIAMSASAGKVALVNSTTALTGTGCPFSASVVDFIGYGTANCFEGAGAAPGLSNTTADARAANGCTDTDNNAADFSSGAPNPRNTASPLNPCPMGDSAPSVSSTTPADGATNVAVDANIDITFSEAVDATGSWFDVSCGTSGAHTAVVSGGPTTFTLNPDSDFVNSESCTVTVYAAQVTDQDTDDPPDNMEADYIFSFDTAGVIVTPDVIITEIMYDPNSTEDNWEWVEIYNAGSSTVDLTGFVVDDNNSVAHTSANIASGTLDAGEQAVLYNVDDVSAADFQAAWGTVNLIPVTDWGAMGLNNSGDQVSLWKSFADYSGDNLTHANAFDTVNYAGAGFPDPVGASIYLTDLNADNNVGSNWATSTVGGVTPLYTGYQSLAAGGNVGTDVGSPGTPSTPPTPPFGVCSDTATFIHDVQGSGLASPLVGDVVVVEGVVVSNFQGPDRIGGYHVQEEDSEADADPLTSEGLYIFDNTNTPSVGDIVRVQGTVREFFNLTELNNVVNFANCGSGGVATPASVTLPVASLDDFEKYEGMAVTFPQALVISEYFNYDRFGELVLALPLDGESRPFTGTAIDEPGAPANARTLANSLRRITLDDGRSDQNPAVVRHPNGGNFALNNRFRGGDTVTNAVGVMDFAFGLYRIQPTGPATYTAVNPRRPAPEPVGGDLRVAAMNTLNFFLTPDNIQEPSSGPDDPADNICGPVPSLECRGWDGDQPLELKRQRDKLLAALVGLDADVIGLNELENTIGVSPLGDPTNGVVAGLNAMLGAGTYDYIDTGVIGTDAIRVGLIYKPAKVTPVGAFQILDSSVDPRFIDTKSRPVLAQTFEEVATGARFTVAVNHLKSKGSNCNDVGDPDIGDGQGNCNQTRKKAAQALVDWLATDPTGSGDPDFLIIGDLNSYAQEDPIDTIKLGSDDTAGTSDDYINLIAQYQGTYAYSYVFDGQFGYLDHALANTSMASQVTGAADWHINADEPDLLDYDTSFKPPAQEAIYEPNAYRSSDHDPVVIGIKLHYLFTGFFPPIQNLPTFNVVKAGQSIPIRFSLNGDQGLNILAAGYPTSEAIACPSSTDPLANIDGTMTAGQSSLSYDPLTDTYTYIWKTNRSWANTCRQLVVKLDDGTFHYADFQFTK